LNRLAFKPNGQLYRLCYIGAGRVRRVNRLLWDMTYKIPYFQVFSLHLIAYPLLWPLAMAIQGTAR
jgi:hypothetical protein